MLPGSLWPLLHSLSTGDVWPPEKPASATALVEAAAREGLLPLLFSAADLPPAVGAALETQRLWARLFDRRAEHLQEMLRAVQQIVEEPFVVLKGLDYAHRLYPRPALRPMQDIDILVPRARFAAVGEKLRRAGKVQQFPGSPTHRVAWFSEAIFDLGDTTLEVHDSFLPRARHTIDYAALWERRVPTTVAGLPTARLSDVDALVYHTLSLAKDEFFARLVRYVDLWLMVRSAPADTLRAAAARAREWQSMHAFYGGLQQLQMLFPETRPLVGPLAAELLPPSTRAFLDRQVLPGLDERSVMVPRRRARQLWRKFWMLDSVWRRTRFGMTYGYALSRGVWAGFWARRRGKVSKGVDSTARAVENTDHFCIRDRTP